MSNLEFRILKPEEFGIPVVGFEIADGGSKFVYFDRVLSSEMGVTSLSNNLKFSPDFHRDANSGLYLSIQNRLLSTLWKPKESKLSVLGNYNQDYQSICDEMAVQLKISDYYNIYLENMLTCEENGEFGELGIGYFM